MDLNVDEKGFEEEMQQQKDRSRAATAVDTEDWIVLKEGSAMNLLAMIHWNQKLKLLKYRKVKAKGKEALSNGIRYNTFLCRKRWTGWRYRSN